MAALWIAPDNTVGGFVDGRPVDPEEYEGPARWAVGERRNRPRLPDPWGHAELTTEGDPDELRRLPGQ